ncbi:MAG TPA: TonB-dependent receptor, partial [Cyclobacteriaceae bacterium]
SEVVITALKHDGIPGEGVALTSSRNFSVEDTKRYAGSLGDPARMVSAFAGVTGGSDENNALVVRGNSPRGVLWRVEGIEVPNPNHFATEGSSHGVVSILSPNAIENSDFLTGAFPAQYGNALSAVFDIHLRNGNNERKEYAVQAGLLGLEATAEGPLRHTHASSYLVNYRYSTLSVLDKLGVGLNEAGQYKDYQDLSFKLHFPTRAGTFSLFGIGGKSKSNLTDTTLFDNNTSDTGVLGLTFSQMVNSNTLLKTSLSYAGSQISKNSEVHGPDNGLLALEENYSKSYTRLSISARRRITQGFFGEGGAIVSRLDYNFFLKNIDTENPAYQVIVNFRERSNTLIFQGFLYARQYFSTRLFGFYGFHFMHFALTRDRSLEPRLGLQWQVTPEGSLSFAYGRHSRVENLQYYLARDHQPGGNEVQFNKNLGFTRANHVVLSYAQPLPSSHYLKTEAYYQQLYNAPVQTNPASFYASINEDTGFITDSLLNQGQGKNYGLEVSLEKSFSGNLYYMVNGSLFQSTFSVHDQPDRNTSYNNNYSLHVLAGKEFETSNQRNRFGVNLKVTHAGGKPYVPIDLERSIGEKRQVYDWDDAFVRKLPDYFRTDFQFVYRLNCQRHSMEWRLDVQNITDRHNPAYYYYDTETESVLLKKQVGIVPLISYRLEF